MEASDQRDTKRVRDRRLPAGGTAVRTVTRRVRGRADWARVGREPAPRSTVDEVALDTPATVAEPDTDAIGTPATPKRRAPRRVRGRVTGRRRLSTVVLLVLVAAAVVFGFVGGQRWYGQRQLDRAHQEALAAAKQATVNFVSISSSTVDRDLQRIQSGATGEFRDEFSRGSGQVRAAVVENAVESHGTVLRAGLVSGDLDSAVVLVAIDATVKNVRAPDGRPSHYRIQVDLARDAHSGRWLVSRLQFG